MQNDKSMQIWKDYDIDLTAYLGTGGYVDYEIRQGAAVIYTGRAYASPDGQCIVRLNEVCADYLAQTLPAAFNTRHFEAADISVAFSVYVGGSSVGSVTFTYDWSYDYDYAPTANAAMPIKDVYDYRMPLIGSALTSGSKTVKIGSTTYTVSATGAGNIIVPGNSLTAEGTIIINGTTYKVKDTCNGYALYYVNAYGAWDMLVMNGAENGSDNYERYSRGEWYSNATSEARGTVEYADKVTRTWQLRTGRLTDSQASRMHHLVGSPLVYLYDISAARFYPVVITDTQCERKTYRNQGRRFPEYTVNVAYAADMQRR